MNSIQTTKRLDTYLDGEQHVLLDSDASEGSVLRRMTLQGNTVIATSMVRVCVLDEIVHSLVVSPGRGSERR